MAVARPTQRDRVLAALKAAGEVGLHTHDMRGEPLWIGNPSQRIAELRDAGYVIVDRRERRGDSNGTRYFLRQAAGGEGDSRTSLAPVRDRPSGRREVAPPPADPEPASLFADPDPQVEGSASQYDPFSEAA